MECRVINISETHFISLRICREQISSTLKPKYMSGNEPAPSIEYAWLKKKNVKRQQQDIFKTHKDKMYVDGNLFQRFSLEGSNAQQQTVVNAVNAASTSSSVPQQQLLGQQQILPTVPPHIQHASIHTQHQQRQQQPIPQFQNSIIDQAYESARRRIWHEKMKRLSL
jgi:hypothetical protein